eukprot:CCRYP_005924-RA/>CCRYP_005924-RA protein AED:0.73 eAED:0.76 QI:0/0/0/1/0/0/2/0/209
MGKSSPEFTYLMISARDKQNTDTATFDLLDVLSANWGGNCDRGRSKCAKVQVRNTGASKMATSAIENSEASREVHPNPKSNAAKRSSKNPTLSFKTIQLDSKVLDHLADKSSFGFYHEDRRNDTTTPPFLSPAIVRDENIPGALHPVSYDQLKPLPPPLPLPKLPSMGYCTWTYDNNTRVLFADFRVSPLANHDDGKLYVTREDEKFLL